MQGMGTEIDTSLKAKQRTFLLSNRSLQTIRLIGRRKMNYKRNIVLNIFCILSHREIAHKTVAIATLMMSAVCC